MPRTKSAEISRPDETTGCLIWLRSTTDGYGRVSIDGRLRYANRVALELKLGRPILPGHKACHTCDNPRCVAPEHLFEGTTAMNAQDASAKGRLRGHNRGAVLWPAKVEWLRERYASGVFTRRQLSDRTGLSQRTISRVVTGQAWGDAPGPISARRGAGGSRV